MNFALFYHSLVSDWNHGNAHFLRGIVTELLSRGHRVQVYEPADSWSRCNLVKHHGTEPLTDFERCYPGLRSRYYRRDNLDLAEITDSADVVIVHEWNTEWLVNGLGKMRQVDKNFRLLFLDTHHRAISNPNWIKRFNLERYDGVLAFGEVLSDLYRRQAWHSRVWTWHEAADTRLFYPRECSDEFPRGDLVWVGNWGDDERSQELEKFLFAPAASLQLNTHVYGVNYPRKVQKRLQARGIDYQGWLANFHTPHVFANHRFTVHVPRRFYVEKLPGIPTIRPFEAMACGIPLISTPWHDLENLFTAGEDFLVARTGREMRKHMRLLAKDKAAAREIARRARRTILSRHTCAHRVDVLLQIIDALGIQFSSLESAMTMERNTRAYAS